MGFSFMDIYGRFLGKGRIPVTWKSHLPQKTNRWNQQYNGGLGVQMDDFQTTSRKRFREKTFPVDYHNKNQSTIQVHWPVPFL